MKTVSVLMPVNNGEDYLREAIESILSQTFDDFEFLIINDGSTDHTSSILTEYQERDPRINICAPGKVGLVAALNLGINIAQGKYIVRMDADDISLPDRLAKQVQFMENHPDVGVCGCGVQYFGLSNKSVTYSREDPFIRSSMIFGSPFIHPSVIIRKEVLTKNNACYREFPHSEDYDLWIQLVQFTHFGLIPDILLRYRVHSNQISNAFSEQQTQTAFQIIHSQIQYLGVNPTDEEFGLHRALIFMQFDPQSGHPEPVLAWFNKLEDANRKSNFYPEPGFFNVLADRWWMYCRFMSPSWKISWLFATSKISHFVPVSRKEKFILIFRPILHKLKAYFTE